MEEENTLREALERVQNAAYHPDDDMFDAFYDFQWEYQRALGNLELSDEEGVRRNVLYAIVELVELLNEVGWKWHRPPSEINEDTFAEEWADVLCFVFNLSIYGGGFNKQSLKGAIARTAAKNATRLWSGVNGGP